MEEDKRRTRIRSLIMIVMSEHEIFLKMLLIKKKKKEAGKGW